MAVCEMLGHVTLVISLTVHKLELRDRVRRVFWCTPETEHVIETNKV